MKNTTNFTHKIYIGKNPDGEKEYLAEPSWDCDWYWGFGYLQNNDIHHHVNSIDNNKNLFDAMKSYYTDIQLSDEKLWIFCDLMKTFYILREVSDLYHRGNSHYFGSHDFDLKNKSEYERINNIVMPELFDHIYALFNKKS